MQFRQFHILLAALLIFVVLSGLVACGGNRAISDKDVDTTDQLPFGEILNASSAWQLIQDNRENESFVLLDVRTPGEFDAGCIAGAINLNANCPTFRSKIEQLDRSRQYLVYCRGGVRSANAAGVMQELGFKYIYDMKPGTLGWVGADLPFEGENVPPSSSNKLTAGGHKILSANGSASIQFEIIDNHLILPVIVDGHRLKLAFETGMPGVGALLYGNKRIDALNLSYIGQAMVYAGADKPVAAEIADGQTLLIADLELNEQTVIVMPADPDKIDSEIDGMIGFAIFDKFVVEIDYNASVLRLTEPADFHYTGSGQLLPLTVTEIGLPRLQVEIIQAGGNNFVALLNLGLVGTEPLLLHAGRYEKINIPSDTINKDGLLIGSISALQLGGQTFSNVVTTFDPDDSPGDTSRIMEGHISFQALSVPKIIIDYTGKKLILESL